MMPLLLVAQGVVEHTWKSRACSSDDATLSAKDAAATPVGAKLVNNISIKDARFGGGRTEIDVYFYDEWATRFESLQKLVSLHVPHGQQQRSLASHLHRTHTHTKQDRIQLHGPGIVLVSNPA